MEVRWVEVEDPGARHISLMSVTLEPCVTVGGLLWPDVVGHD